MVDRFKKLYPPRISKIKPGSAALVLNRPRPVALMDGAWLFAVRFTIRKGRSYKQRVTKRGQRLTYRWVHCTLYTVDRYEYAVFYWFDTSKPPDMLGQFETITEAEKLLEAEFCQATSSVT